jgi:hypothetical protein
MLLAAHTGNRNRIDLSRIRLRPRAPTHAYFISPREAAEITAQYCYSAEGNRAIYHTQRRMKPRSHTLTRLNGAQIRYRSR